MIRSIPGGPSPLVHNFSRDQSDQQVPAGSLQMAANSLLDSLWQVFLLLGCSRALLREKGVFSGGGGATAPPSVARPDVISLERLILVACHTRRIHARSIRHEESLRMITRTEYRCASSVWRALKCDSCWVLASSHTSASRRTGCALIRVPC